MLSFKPLINLVTSWWSTATIIPDRCSDNYTKTKLKFSYTSGDFLPLLYTFKVRWMPSTLYFLKLFLRGLCGVVHATGPTKQDNSVSYSCYCSVILSYALPFSSTYLAVHRTQSSAAVFKNLLLIHFSPVYCLIYCGRHTLKNSLPLGKILRKIATIQGYHAKYCAEARCSMSIVINLEWF